MYSIQSLLIQDNDKPTIDQPCRDILHNDNSFNHSEYIHPPEIIISHETVQESLSPEHKSLVVSPVVSAVEDNGNVSRQHSKSPIEKYPELDLSAFQRKTKKVLQGFGIRSFPPQLSVDNQGFYHLRIVPPTRVDDKFGFKSNSLRYSKPLNGFKPRGFIVDKAFKPRRWKLSSGYIPLVGGSCLSTSKYAPEEDQYKPYDKIPFREVQGLSKMYRVSTLSRPHVPPCAPVANGPTVQFRNIPASGQALLNAKKSSNSRSKTRVLCTVPNCNKDFADRSSLQRHKKRLHPELF